MKFRKIIGILLIMCLLLGTVLIPAYASEQSYAQAYLDEQMEFYEVNGVACVTKNGKVMCQSARGMAKEAESKEMTVDTMFPIGSISKQFCATAILLLQEQGKLSVDENIVKYFPEYTKASDVTIKNLLTMRSGVPAHTDAIFEEYVISVDNTEEENQQIILDWLYSKELLFKPDTKHRYSNTNFFLLSLIVEKVSGQSYADFIKENIFTPLEMNNSGFYEELMNHPDLAEHTLESDLYPLDPEFKGLSQGAGDLVSNAKDLDKWLTSLRDCTLLSEESTAEMITNYSPDNRDGYGYGVYLTDDGGVWHGGAIDSYASFAITYPEEGYNVLFFTNVIEIDPTEYEVIVFEIANDLKNQALCGDVNCDGKVDIMDATAIQKHLADITALTDEGYAVADVDGSGVVNVVDATSIQKYLAGIEKSLTIGEFITIEK